MDMFSSRHGLPSAWIIFSLPRLFPKDQSCQWVTEFADLNTSSAVSLELKVLLASPEADWPFLVKVMLSANMQTDLMIMFSEIGFTYERCPFDGHYFKASL